MPGAMAVVHALPTQHAAGQHDAQAAVAVHGPEGLSPAGQQARNLHMATSAQLGGFHANAAVCHSIHPYQVC